MQSSAFPSSATDLRARLRAGSRAEHARVDAAVTALDLTDAADLERFLSAHHAAFVAMAPSAGGESRAVIDDLVARLEDDLEALGGVRPRRRRAAACDPVAVDYVLLGSRLGSAVLKRRWGAAAPGTPAAGAARYFAAPGQGAAWRSLCRTLAARPGTGACADRIVADTQRLFELFDDALARAGARRQVIA